VAVAVVSVAVVVATAVASVVAAVAVAVAAAVVAVVVVVVSYHRALIQEEVCYYGSWSRNVLVATIKGRLFRLGGRADRHGL
jgi:hypothetical protein